MVKKFLVVASIIAVLSATLFILYAVTISAGSTPLSNENSDNLGWRLVVDGLVKNPLKITYTDLLAMPSVTMKANLQCVDDPSGLGSVTSDWTGVPLKAILERAGVYENAIKVAFFATDRYSTDLKIETAMRPDIIVAYKQDGKFLTNSRDNTPALRLVVPGKWGYKWINWLINIKVVDFDYFGTWEGSGYPDEADIPSKP